MDIKPFKKNVILNWDLLYQHFCTKKSSRLVEKTLQSSFLVEKNKYGFLEDLQIWGRVYQKFNIPNVCGKVNKKLLKQHVTKGIDKKKIPLSFHCLKMIKTGGNGYFKEKGGLRGILSSSKVQRKDSKEEIKKIVTFHETPRVHILSASSISQPESDSSHQLDYLSDYSDVHVKNSSVNSEKESTKLGVSILDLKTQCSWSCKPKTEFEDDAKEVSFYDSDDNDGDTGVMSEDDYGTPNLQEKDEKRNNQLHSARTELVCFDDLVISHNNLKLLQWRALSTDSLVTTNDSDSSFLGGEEYEKPLPSDMTDKLTKCMNNKLSLESKNLQNIPFQEMKQEIETLGIKEEVGTPLNRSPKHSWYLTEGMDIDKEQFIQKDETSDESNTSFCLVNSPSNHHCEISQDTTDSNYPRQKQQGGKEENPVLYHRIVHDITGESFTANESKTSPLSSLGEESNNTSIMHSHNDKMFSLAIQDCHDLDGSSGGITFKSLSLLCSTSSRDNGLGFPGKLSPNQDFVPNKQLQNSLSFQNKTQEECKSLSSTEILPSNIEHNEVDLNMANSISHARSSHTRNLKIKRKSYTKTGHSVKKFKASARGDLTEKLAVSSTLNQTSDTISSRRPLAQIQLKSLNEPNRSLEVFTSDDKKNDTSLVSTDASFTSNPEEWSPRRKYTLTKSNLSNSRNNGNMPKQTNSRNQNSPRESWSQVEMPYVRHARSSVVSWANGEPLVDTSSDSSLLLSRRVKYMSRTLRDF